MVRIITRQHCIALKRWEYKTMENKKYLYIIIAYDDEGNAYVYADDDNMDDASFTAAECNGFVRVVEV